MLAPILPHNVLRVVFDGLEKQSLKQCSLVCRSWTLPAGYYIFSELTFWTSRGQTDFLAFLECLQRSQRIPPSLRELTLSGERRHNEPWGVECSLATLRQVLAHLPCLQDMRIQDAMFYEPSPMAYSPTIALRKLEFSHGDFAPNAGLASILRLFTKIGHLNIQNLRQLGLCGSDMSIEYAPSHPTQVQNMTIADFGYPQPGTLDWQSGALTTLVESLCRVLDFSTLTNIHLESVLLQHAEIYSRLFLRCNALVHLVVGRITGSLLAIPNFTLNLSACHNLRVIHLKNLCITVEDRPTQQRLEQNRLTWQFVCNMLSSIPANNNVQRLQLDVALKRNGSTVGHPDLDFIHRYLKQMNWMQFNEELRSLRRLQVVWVKVTEHTQGGEAFVHLMLSYLSKRVRRMVYIERRLSFAQWGSAYEMENLQSWAVESCHRVRNFQGVTVLRVDPVARFQVVKLG